MKITIWHDNGAGSEFTSDDYAYIEVNGKTVWNKAALKTVEGQNPPTNTASLAIAPELLETYIEPFSKNVMRTVCDTKVAIQKFCDYVKEQRRA
jgi:hypothetical protein